MKIEMKKINYKIFLGILLLVALIGGVVLVQQRQETRRGATSLIGFIRLSLDESSTTKQITAGQEFTVPIVANLTGAGGVDSVVAYFCYDPTKIELKDTSALENSFVVSSPTSYVGGSIKVSESTNKCVKVTFVSVVQNTKLNSSVATIKFKTVASSGTGTITMDKSNSSLGVAGQDTVDVSSVGNLNYLINSVEGGSTVNIKLAFAGVKKDNGKCATNWPVTVKVLNNTGVNVLDNTFKATPTQTTSVNSKGEIIYDYNVTVSNVPTTGASNLAFFLTGPKHVSIKFGENNQKAWYSTLAGSLILNKGVTNSYDFSNFSLLAGDMNGDGKIDSRDYSFIKEKANDLLPAATAGTDVVGDIDGNCQANAGDVRLFKELLKEVNGQIY